MALLCKSASWTAICPQARGSRRPSSPSDCRRWTRRPRGAREAVARILKGPSLLRAEQVAAASGLTLRSLQRLFSDYVGIGPKWVIQRYRLHEAIARLDEGERVDFARLALDLGYADQAHFIRDFKALVGRTPREYARQGRR